MHGVALTPPRVIRVRNRLCHDNWSVNASIGPIDTKFDEQVVQQTLHYVPVAHYTGAGVERVPELAARSRIDVGIMSDELTGLVQFSVPVSAHHRGQYETGALVERPAGFYEVGA